MSLINDALKRARQTAPSDAPPPLPGSQLQPVAHSSEPVAGWFIPAFVICLVVAGAFFVGKALTSHSVKAADAVTISPAPAAVAVPAAPAVVAPAPPAKPVTPPVVVQSPKSAPPARPPAVPKLQGIFYSPTAPAAIVDGKTVRPGDRVLQYRVAEITKLTVTLADADGKVITLGMDN